MANDIFVLEANANPRSRESIVLGTLIEALRHRAGDQDASFRQARCAHEEGGFSSSAKFSGAFRFVSESKIVAAGQGAFLELADYYKSAIFVDSVGLLPAIGTQLSAPDPDVVKRIFWSSTNSSTMVALGKAAWQALQLLPGGGRHYFPCPPIRLPSLGRVSASAANPVLIIVHGNDRMLLNEACDIADRLRKDLDGGLEAYGFRMEGAVVVQAENVGDSKASVHVHIGEHGEDANAVRISDSWMSGRTVVQYVPNSRRSDHFDGYQIDDGVNGLITSSVDQTVKTVAALVKDQFLQGTLSRVGLSMTSASRQEWERIVDILVN